MKLFIESSGKVFDLCDAATGITWESTYRGGAARLAAGADAPVDAAIVGIVDP